MLPPYFLKGIHNFFFDPRPPPGDIKAAYTRPLINIVYDTADLASQRPSSDGVIGVLAYEKLNAGPP